ncbi:MAG: NAD(P)H-hydrate dehydratase [Anaerolineales bacterium]|nr:NAD(P)H-hydrate dehydratase [Anaerolineales bacterium]
MMQKLVSVAEMMAIEKAADASGLSYAQMMENAGTALANTVHDAYSQHAGKGALALVGSGNNGGDALVALDVLAQHGWRVAAYIAGKRAEDDPLMTRVKQAGGEIIFPATVGGYIDLAALLPQYKVLLDGLLGTGIKLPLRQPVPAVLQIVRDVIESGEADPLIIAVDCPSGIDCDSGEAAEETLQADLTVCMAAVKVGLLKNPAFGYLGKLALVGIGLPADLEAYQAINRFVVDPEMVKDFLPPRPLNAHKGTFGTALVVAGSVNFSGAALLSGEAAYRIGAGLVTLACPEPLHAALAGQIVEATWLPLPHEAGFIAEEAAPIVAGNLERITAMLIGPGFGQMETTGKFLDDLTAKVGTDLPPLVVDADGLKLLSKIKDWPQRLPKPAVLTPHPGEMSVLTGESIADIQQDRLATAEHYAKHWGHVVVLKGAFTVIASPDDRTAIIPVAAPALARAGTGDVLAGIITGLRAQGVPAFAAAAIGAWLHAQAGLAAAEAVGHPAATLAGDLIPQLAKVMSDLA